MVRWRGRRGGGTSCGSTSECEGNGSDCFFFFFSRVSLVYGLSFTVWDWGLLSFLFCVFGEAGG